MKQYQKLGFFDLQNSHRTCLCANTARNTFGRCRLFGYLDHNTHWTDFHTFSAVCTFLFIDHINTFCILSDSAGFANLCTFSALNAVEQASTHAMHALQAVLSVSTNFFMVYPPLNINHLQKNYNKSERKLLAKCRILLFF